VAERFSQYFGCYSSQNCFHHTYLVRLMGGMCSKYGKYSNHPNWVRLMRLRASSQQHLHGPRRTWWPRWHSEIQLLRCEIQVSYCSDTYMLGSWPPLHWVTRCKSSMQFSLGESDKNWGEIWKKVKGLVKRRAIPRKKKFSQFCSNSLKINWIQLPGLVTQHRAGYESTYMFAEKTFYKQF
jgi:hypothetical protein